MFGITKLYDHIYNWFDILKSKGIKITAFVIMPKHLHAIIFYPSELNDDSVSVKEQSINNVIGTGKRFMAYEIIKRLKRRNEKDILYFLKSGVNDLKKARKKLHQVF